MATKLILIRHAQTDWNLKKRYCGSNDIGLNANGKRQAQKLCRRLKTEKIYKVYSSDKKRALETAGITFDGLKIEKTPDLREMHFGCFEGLNHGEIIKKYPDIYKKWLKNPFGLAIPEAETLIEFKERVVKAFKKIISLNRNKTIAAVSHGGSISVFITHILKTDNFWKYIPHSASLTVVEYKNGKPKILLFNDGTMGTVLNSKQNCPLKRDSSRTT